MIAIFSHVTVTKGTMYAYQSINHVNLPLLVSAISFWRDSSFPLIINCRGPCQKLTYPIFLLPEARMLAPELLQGYRMGYLRTLEAKT